MKELLDLGVEVTLYKDDLDGSYVVHGSRGNITATLKTDGTLHGVDYL